MIEHLDKSRVVRCRAMAVAAPLLFATFFIVSFYSANMRYFRPSVVIGPWVVTLVAAGIIMLVVTLLTRSLAKGSVVATVLVVAVFLHPYALAMAGFANFHIAGHLWGANTVLAPAALLGWSAVLAAVLRRPRLPAWTVQALATGAACLLLSSLALIGWEEMQRWQGAAQGSVGAAYETNGTELPAAKLPDIFYVVLDGYARDDVLATGYGYNNRPFLDALTARGFYVARSSCANYVQTSLSQASTLNFVYLQTLLSGVADSDDRGVAGKLLVENRLWLLLKNHGYTILNFPSGYYLTLQVKRDYDCAPADRLDEFSAAVLRRATAWVPYFIRNQWTADMTEYHKHRRRILSAVRELSCATDHRSPFFVYAHIVCPHPPFVFSAEGAPRDPALPYDVMTMDGDHLLKFLPGGQSEYVAGYRAQVQFLNREILNSIDTIRERARAPYVIVLQADHGPGARLAWEKIEETDLRERVAILNAYYFSDGDYSDLRPDISPVNTFRVIARKYFGQNLPPLPDRSYFSTWSRPYRFVEVSAAERRRAEAERQQETIAPDR